MEMGAETTPETSSKFNILTSELCLRRKGCDNECLAWEIVRLSDNVYTVMELGFLRYYRRKYRRK
jgi:hypothetical protein